MFAFVLTALLTADGPVAGANVDRVRFFESAIRPVLVERCGKCHGETKQWGGLRVDSREALLRGGDSGAAIVPGKPNESLLIRAIRHEDADYKMPKDGKLTDRQIADFVRWVELGAPFPESVKPAKRTRDPQHWSFQTPVAALPPTVRNSEWAQNAIDRFVLEKLEQAGLSPAAPADKRTLIRRVTFDLIGLPPTVTEIDEFLSDESPDAFERVVDRLLASPRYGERWGRHWLDVARYADSNGLDENVCHGNAWRYRDYVVAAFNSDKPFDQFVMEQLAGDLLPHSSEDQRHEQLIATGFLGIGPKVLAETDEAKMRMDIIDEQLDTTGRAFLGLTLGCARCHDHKFDPISTADYYGLAGIFKSTRSMRKYTKLAEWHENLLESAAATAMKSEFESQVAAKKSRIADVVAAADRAAREKLPSDAKPPEKLETLYPDETKAELKKLREELTALEKTGVALPSAMGVAEDKVVDVAVHLRGNPLKLGEVVSRRVPKVLRGPDSVQFTDQESGRRQLAEWLIDSRHPLTARVIVNRVWRWQFGKGLVSSTDNFGLLGEAPSHPELLDWLACRLVSDGWSIKSLHRLILNSNTYRQSSMPAPEAVTRDPENRLLSRREIRRLQAEAVRDSLLAVSGQLDSTIGGSLLKLKNRDYFFDHTSKDLTTYDVNRRSLYLPVVRNNVFDMFQLLDFPDPAVSSSDRATTVVAPQALLLMNSDFVMQAAASLADRLLQDSDEERRIQTLYRAACGRDATLAELQSNREFLSAAVQALSAAVGDEAERNRRAMSLLCQTVLATNEFVYIR